MREVLESLPKQLDRIDALPQTGKEAIDKRSSFASGPQLEEGKAATSGLARRQFMTCVAPAVAVGQTAASGALPPKPIMVQAPQHCPAPPIPQHERIQVVVDYSGLMTTLLKFYQRAAIDFERLFDPISHVARRRIEIIATSACMSAKRQDHLLNCWDAYVWNAGQHADAIVASSILHGAREAHRVILCADDGPYAGAIDFVRSKGVVVEVWAVAEALSQDLRRNCDVVRVLDAQVLSPRPRTPPIMGRCSASPRSVPAA